MKIFRFIIGILIGTSAIEFSFRAFEAPLLWRVMPIASYMPRVTDRYTAYANEPGGFGIWLSENRARIKFNAIGMHDRERTIVPQASTFRVAVLGDSVTEAVQVQQAEAFTALAERKLAHAGGRPTEIINLGLSNAYDAVQIENYRSKGAQLMPDAIVAVVAAMQDGGYLVYPLRDDTVMPAYRRGEDGKLFISHAFLNSGEFLFWSGRYGSMTRSLLEHLRVIRLAYQRWNIGFWQGRGVTGRAPKPKGGCKDLGFDAHWRLWVDHDPADQNDRLDAYLSDLRSFSQGGHIPVYLILIGPLLDCPYSEAKAGVLEQAIKDRAASYGIKATFAPTEMRKRVSRPIRSLFGFKADIGEGHLNHLGHSVMADILADIVAADGQPSTME